MKSLMVENNQTFFCSYEMENDVRGTCYFFYHHCVLVVALFEGIGQNVLSVSEYFNSK